MKDQDGFPGNKNWEKIAELGFVTGRFIYYLLLLLPVLAMLLGACGGGGGGGERGGHP